MNQADLLKLAEIAGVDLKINGVEDYQLEYWTNEKLHYMGWKPHKDLNQAFECLEGLGLGWQINYYKNSGKSVSIYGVKEGVRINYEFSAQFPEAICKAVLEASK